MSKLVECRSCKQNVEHTAKKCPNCGVDHPGVRVWHTVLVCTILALIVVALMSGSPDTQTTNTQSSEADTATAKPDNDAFTAEAIKTLSSDIMSVKLHPQVTKENTFLVDLDMETTVLWGGAQDWNEVAATVSTISKKLLEHPEAERINFNFHAKDNNGLNWAAVFLERNKLPNDFQKLTYLEFFSFVRTAPGTLQTAEWECEFFKEYQSARPNGKMPKYC